MLSTTMLYLHIVGQVNLISSLCWEALERISFVNKKVLQSKWFFSFTIHMQAHAGQEFEENRATGIKL